ncbi:MAG: MerR family transcriptional regulator [Candidatus Eisenbacteria bacterium]
MHDPSRHLLRIGDLARQTGKTVRAIHLYEELGLLQPATRSSGGFRLYEPVAVERVRWIEMLNGLGFSLQEMKSLLRSWWNAGLGPDAMDELRVLFTRKLEETREHLRRQQRLEKELIEGLAYLETCRVCASPSDVRTCVHCQQDHGMKVEPALVAGLKSAPGAARPRSGIVRVEEIE